MDKPFVAICSYCQKENPAVDSAVKSHEKDINFSHGICKRHTLEMLKQMNMPEDKIQAFMAKVGVSVSDLKENPELAKSYSKGIFTPQQIQQSGQGQKDENSQITERLQVLAGIRNLYN